MVRCVERRIERYCRAREIEAAHALGRLGRAKPILESSTKTVEGVATTEAVMKRAQAMGLEMPICSVLDKILFHDATLDEGLNNLLLRPFKSESIC